MRFLEAHTVKDRALIHPRYSDQLVRRTMAKFYGEFQVDSFRRQMKESRKIEELILKFASYATAVLKKEPTLAGEGWKHELNNQIAQFIKLLRECLRNVHHVSPELHARLDAYTSKLAPALAAQSQYTQSDSGYESSTSNHPPAISWRIADMPLVKVVAQLFKIPDGPMQDEVDKIRGEIVTEKVRLSNHINNSSSVQTLPRLPSRISRPASRTSTPEPPSPAVARTLPRTQHGTTGNRPRLPNFSNSWS